MKKILLFIAVMAMGLGSVNAQDNLKWGVVAGMNVSKMSTAGLDNKIGYHVGVRAELGLPQVANGLYLDAAALISAKGAKTDAGDLGGINVNATYLEIPIHVGYKYAVNDNFNVFGSFGPYVGIGLFGKTKVDELDYDSSHELVNTSYKYNTFGDGYKRFDMGLGLNVGVEIQQKYRISLGYDFGLLKAFDAASENNGDDEEMEINLASGAKNRNLTISVAYMF